MISRPWLPRTTACAAIAAVATGLGTGCSSALEPASATRVEQVGKVSSPVLTTPNNWLTRSHDIERTGATTSETTLTQSSVAFPNGFGKLYDVSVDDRVWAQVLYASSISGSAYSSGAHNVFFVATANNSVQWVAERHRNPLGDKPQRPDGRRSRDPIRIECRKPVGAVVVGIARVG